MIYSNIIAYADDIVLLAPSATGLQLLIDIAFNEAHGLELKFNVLKSKCMVFSSFGNKTKLFKDFKIGEHPLGIVHS